VYLLFADLVLILHALFIVFVVLGGFLVLRHQSLACLHIPCAVWGILIEYKGWICPLTYLENDLRAAAGSDGYSGTFIDRYLMPLVYPPGLNFEVQMMLGTAVLIINIIVYTLVWRRWKRQ
jgi:hypothetical protein